MSLYYQTPLFPLPKRLYDVMVLEYELDPADILSDAASTDVALVMVVGQEFPGEVFDDICKLVSDLSMVWLYQVSLCPASRYFREFIEGAEYYFGTDFSRAGAISSLVQCIYQDRRGFMWLGTEDGLNQSLRSIC